METKRNVKQPGPIQWSPIERWVVERLDQDAGVARIECVPMRSEYTTAEFAEALVERGVEEGMDRFSHWDVARAHIRRLSIKRLAAELGLRSRESESLSENMVFWVLSTTSRQPRRIIHATRAARETAKDLYREAARREELRS